ncbi:carboxylesterase/lipase family protein [Caulobacter sp. S45]|uniref:carboxylesterase/lipase family protein n=1 Tax=Caulobacter sp. S45 TaxID=1641861 RepID=UPI00131D2387|nr:carboxylesterase/lipase family protein [Caulobacter sp. S45]
MSGAFGLWRQALKTACLGATSVLALAGAACAEPVKAVVDSGALVGEVADGVATFKGIPFAAPPVGALRWRPPAAPQPWTGERDATRFGAGCPQKDGPDKGGPQTSSEDCLFLNVWTPAEHPAGASLPVMVWIHGGGWRNGHGSDPAFDGKAFVHDGVVLVTVNYRLGALGFFAHPALTREAAPDAPLGNYGLMDNIAALEWVKRNVAAFGGDPRRVTVFGESAGGGQVLSLLTVSRAKGLFQQAIVESGPAFGLPRGLAAQEKSGVDLAVRLGLPQDASADALRAIKPETLVETPTDAAPFIDGRLVKQLPQAVFEAGRNAHVPLIIGTNSDEGSLTPYYASAADQTMALYRLRAATDTLRASYGADAPDAATLRRWAFADTIFGAPARKIATEASSAAPVFLYRFGYVRQDQQGRRPGAAHGSEMVFAFDTLATAHAPADPKDEAVAKTMHGCWASFAKTGRPACPDAAAWPAYDAKRDTLMLFGADGAVRPVADYDKPSFDFIQHTMLDPPLPSMEAVQAEVKQGVPASGEAR